MRKWVCNTKEITLIIFVIMVLSICFSLAVSEAINERTYQDSEENYKIGSEQTFNPIESELLDGITDGEWDDIQSMMQEALYYPTWSQASEGYVASNPGNQWGIIFDRGAVKVSPTSGEDWSCILTPFGYGYESSIQSLNNDLEVIIHENRIEFVYNRDLTGWYINDEKGLEHGFILTSPPQPRTSDNLLFEMNLQTSLTSKIINQGDNIVFLDDSGKEILNYGKLYVTDAEGQTIPSELSLTSNSITISVDDTDAVYPLIVDPLVITEIKKLTASDGRPDDCFGMSVSINGDTVVVGAPFNPFLDTEIGSAYIFDRNQSGLDNWGEVVKLTPSDGEPDDHFGHSVSVFGDTVAVGAYGESSGVTNHQGAVYIFERNFGGPDNWGEVVKVLASDGLDNDGFGRDVFIDVDTLVVGAAYDDIGGIDDQGSVYIFERNQGGSDNWGFVEKIIAPDGMRGDYFGVSISLSQDTLAVGAMGDQVGANICQGSAYIFERDQGGSDNWGFIAKITASNGYWYDYFGTSVSLSKDTLVVGCYGSNNAQGSAYIFERDFGGANNWGEVALLSALDGEEYDFFGYTVSISGDTVVVGASGDNIDENAAQGSGYIFDRNQGGENNWGLSEKITASDGEGSDYFGASVSIHRDTLIIGANNDNISGNLSQGSAYIFYLSSTNYIPIITTTDITTSYEDSQYYVDYNAYDADGDTLTWSLITNTSGWLTIDSNTGVLSGTPQNSDVGIWSVNVSVSDGNGGTDFSSFTLEVVNTNDVPVIITSNDHSAIVDELYSVDYEATDDDLDTLNWELSTNASWLGIVGSTGVLSGTPIESEEGSYWVNVSVSDGNGGNDYTFFTLTVVKPNFAPVIVTDDVLIAFENVLYSVDYEATDGDQDALTWSLDTNASWLSIHSTSGILSGTPESSDIGSYWVEVSVSDGNGGSDQADFTVEVLPDNDGDGISDEEDSDDDNDGYLDDNDDFPMDENEWRDTDSDGTGDNADDDDDDDEIDDDEDDFPFDPAASIDTDGDGKPDDWNEGYNEGDSTTGLVVDDDDDDDGVPDIDDKYPLDPTKSKDAEEQEFLESNLFLLLIVIIVIVVIILLALISKGGKKSGIQVAPMEPTGAVEAAPPIETQALKCPQCQNSFEAPLSATSIQCPHCGFIAKVE